MPFPVAISQAQGAIFFVPASDDHMSLENDSIAPPFVTLCTQELRCPLAVSVTAFVHCRVQTNGKVS